MESRSLLGLMVIGMVALGIGLGTVAYLSDSETSEDNSFTAGTLDLKVDDLDDPNVYHFAVGGLQPTDSGEHTFILKNAGSIAGYASMEIQNVADNGNGLEEPEQDAGDASDGAGQGELDEQTLMKAWVDDCDNVYEAGEDVIFERYANNLPMDVDLLDDVNPYVDSDIQLGGGEQACIALGYIFENRAGTENNMAQGDSFQFDILFDLNQVQPTTSTTSTTSTSTTTSTTTSTSTSTTTSTSTSTSTTSSTTTTLPPTTVILIPSADSWVSSRSGETGNYGSDTQLRIMAAYRYDLLRFDLSSLSGKTIDSAYMRIYISDDGTFMGGGTADAHRITGSWTESGVTWSNKPSYSGTATSSISVTGTGWTPYWDVTSDVQAFASGTTNNGWWLKDHNENFGYGCYFRCYSKDYTTDPALRPQLVVTYH